MFEKYCVSRVYEDGSEEVVASCLSDVEMLRFLIDNCKTDGDRFSVVREMQEDRWCEQILEQVERKKNEASR